MDNLPITGTPLNLSAVTPRVSLSYEPGRFYNLAGSCTFCGGWVLGYKGRKFEVGRCTVCGQMFSREHKRVSGLITSLLDCLKNHSESSKAYPIPPWLSGLSSTGLQCFDPLGIIVDSPADLVTELRARWKNTSCYPHRICNRVVDVPSRVFMLERYPGLPAGLIFQSPEGQQWGVWFKKIVPELGKTKDIWMGCFLKLHPSLESFVTVWEDLITICLSDFVEGGRRCIYLYTPYSRNLQGPADQAVQDFSASGKIPISSSSVR